MRRVIAALILAVALVGAVTAEAAEPKKWRPPLFGKINAWQLAIAGSHLLPGYFLHISAHEYIGHALPITLAGGTVTKVSIVPERIDGTWYLGATHFDGDFTRGELVFIDLGPYMMDAFLFSLTETLFASGAVRHDSILAPALFVTGELLPWWDFTAAVLNPSADSDLAMFERDLRVHPAITRTIGGVVAAGGLALLTWRAIKILNKKSPRIRKMPKITFVPFITADGVGFTIRF